MKSYWRRLPSSFCKGIGYSGYMSFELCYSLPVVNGQTVRIEFAQKNAKMAAEFMKGIIEEVMKA